MDGASRAAWPWSDEALLTRPAGPPARARPSPPGAGVPSEPRHRREDLPIESSKASEGTRRVFDSRWGPAVGVDFRPQTVNRTVAALSAHSARNQVFPQ